MTDTDIDLSEFYKLSRPKKRPCIVAHLTDGMSARERKQLHAACAADPGVITNSAIVAWLERHDPTRGAAGPISVSAVVSHRKNRCTCGDD